MSHPVYTLKNSFTIQCSLIALKQIHKFYTKLRRFRKYFQGVNSTSKREQFMLWRSWFPLLFKPIQSNFCACCIRVRLCQICCEHQCIIPNTVLILAAKYLLAHSACSVSGISGYCWIATRLQNWLSSSKSHLISCTLHTLNNHLHVKVGLALH